MPLVYVVSRIAANAAIVSVGIAAVDKLTSSGLSMYV